MSTPETPRPLIALVDAVDKALKPDAIRAELRALFGDETDWVDLTLSEFLQAAILDSVVKRVTPLLAPVAPATEDPAPREPRVWQEGDTIPADVPHVHGKRGWMSRQAAAQNRGPDGWWSPGTGVISEHRLLSEHGPVSEVLPDATGGQP